MNRRDLIKASALAATASAIGGAHAATHARPRFDPERSAIVFIEFQNQWLDAGSPLNALMQDRRQFDDAVANAARVIGSARERGVRIVHAGLSLVHDPDYAIFAGGIGKSGLRGAIPKAATWRTPEQVAFPQPFTPRDGEFVVSGRSGASVIINSTLDPYLRNQRIDHLYLLGFALHVCVESTLRHAHDLGYEVTVVADAAPAFTREQQAHVLEHVLHHFGRSIGSDELIGQM